MVKVSIILTSYNKPDLVGKSIQSILVQTHTDWELFIMDDHSNQETLSAILPFLQDSRITYINSNVKDEDRHKVTRYAYLINQAYEQLTGDYVCYLTDDTEYLPHRLEKMLAYFQENPGKDVVYSRQKAEYYNHDGRHLYYMLLPAEDVLERAANRVDHCSVMHTRRIAEKIRKKHGTYWDDDRAFWFNADAVFWSRLNEFSSFYPISEVLDITRKTPHSYQQLSVNLPDRIPEGTIVKGISPCKYIIEGETRRPLSDAMYDQLYLENIIEIPDPVLFKYREGTPVTWKALHDGLLIKEDDFLYYLQNQKKRRVSQEALRYYWPRKRIIELNHTLSMDIGDPVEYKISETSLLPDGVLFKHNGNYYLSEQNQLCFIQEDIAQNKFFYRMDLAVSLTDKEFTWFEQGNPFVWQLPFK
ncbi:glycosyltransferase family 2 protein [Fictibacillus fluitans]|uniref:Glycosyltransferase family 2 protein n=1 Tax=Fictibacillus fluitans TaxID=3058422 RepID=A0ABT8HS73_9BACL|nr:glycosyltransferase family 2 protein [Fictibacillus sp. NE201]MDN4523619.1 glycosyltransferase family 2 protein [Fictibacillus sp. NE201]